MRGLANKEVRDTPAPESVRCYLRAAFWSITSNVVGNPVMCITALDREDCALE